MAGLLYLVWDACDKSDTDVLEGYVLHRGGPRAVWAAMLATPAEAIKYASVDERARATRVLEHVQPISSRRLGLLHDAAITPFLPRYPLERTTAPTLVVGVATTYTERTMAPAMWPSCRPSPCPPRRDLGSQQYRGLALVWKKQDC